MTDELEEMFSGLAPDSEKRSRRQSPARVVWEKLVEEGAATVAISPSTQRIFRRALSALKARSGGDVSSSSVLRFQQEDGQNEDGTVTVHITLVPRKTAPVVAYLVENSDEQ